MSTETEAPAPESPMISPLLVLGLDGATFDVIHPMLARGLLPNLARMMELGAWSPLRSTTPPVTFPAWSSFMTGLEPGRHGLFDFTQKLPGAYRIRFVNASDRRGSSLFARISQAGGRVLVLGVPATFPPEPVEGLLVPGFDAPVSTGSDAAATSDPALYREIEKRAGPWMRPAMKEGPGAPLDRTRAHLLDRIERKTRFALAAIDELRATGSLDFMMIVFSESDTVGHHFWRHHDPNSPRHDPAADEAARSAIEAVYSKLDAACGQLQSAFGEQAACVVMSDHGMGGASRFVVHLNRYLAECGLLERKQESLGLSVDRESRRLRDALLRFLPAGIAQRLFRRARAAAARVESGARFGGIDWKRTLAFSEEANTNPGVWINLQGREAQGGVAPEDYERVRDRVIEALLAWRLPNGEPVVARAVRRENLYRGPFVARAPDIALELALDNDGYGLSLVASRWEDEGSASVTRLDDADLAGGRGLGMNGTHRADGILIGTGTDLRLAQQQPSQDLPGREHPRLVDMAPTLLAAMGIEWETSEGEADGVSIPLGQHRYSVEEEAMVAERLRALGYLE
ncbi:MAG: alkaline phosphatase family protein [Deltaproteobacteria bacterium]|nr:alkaline phosphatase family protein [Deltaproteobacteria bacterium]